MIRTIRSLRPKWWRCPHPRLVSIAPEMRENFRGRQLFCWDCRRVLNGSLAMVRTEPGRQTAHGKWAQEMQERSLRIEQILTEWESEEER